MKIGNMNGLPWYLRFGIFAVIALVIYGGFWYFVTSGTRKETKDLQAQIDTFKKANAEAQIASQRLSEFRAAYKNKQEELAELNALLPEQREITKVLEGIQDRARMTGLSLRKFSPKDDVPAEFFKRQEEEDVARTAVSALLP